MVKINTKFKLLPSRLSIGLSDGMIIGTSEEASSVLFVSVSNLLSKT